MYNEKKPNDTFRLPLFLPVCMRVPTWPIERARTGQGPGVGKWTVPSYASARVHVYYLFHYCHDDATTTAFLVRFFKCWLQRRNSIPAALRPPPPRHDDRLADRLPSDSGRINYVKSSPTRPIHTKKTSPLESTYLISV